MSAVVNIAEKRLRITAVYAHETVEYHGNIFAFIEELVRERKTGIGTFSLNEGDARSLTFDCRKMVDGAETKRKQLTKE